MGVKYEHIPRYDRSSWNFRIYDRPRFEDPFHFHPEFEINYIRHGTGARVVGDSIRRFVSGEVILLGSNLPHYWYNSDVDDKSTPAKSIICQFKHEFLGELFFNTPEMENVQNLLNRSQRGILFKGESRRKLKIELRSMICKDTVERLVTLLNILHIMSKADRGDIEYLASPGCHLDIDYSVHLRIEQTYELIYKRYRQYISLENAAEIACMSRSAFCRFFKKYTGHTFVETLNNFRISEACRILSETNRSILDTAYEVGFQNLTHFYRSFRKYEGVSPSSYRKSIQFNIEKKKLSLNL